MGIVKRSYKIGSQAMFFREDVTFTINHLGATVAATPAGRNAKPGAAQASGWEDLGAIEEAEDAVTFGDVTKIKAPTPGKLRVWDVIAGDVERTIKLMLQEVTPQAIQAYYLCQALTTSSTVFDPTSLDLVKGWLKLQCYDHKDREWIHTDSWVCLVPNGSIKMNGKEIIKLGFDAVVMHSSLNTGSLAM